MSREALALGLSPGLTLADARARIPNLAVADHDPIADAAFLSRAAEACGRWTPLVALDPPDGLLLDVSGCAHLFGSEAVLRDDVVRRFRGGKIEVRATIACAPDSARALARFGNVAVVPEGGDAVAVRPLPIEALELPEQTRAALSLAGMKCVADLADRPSQPLAARFGQDLTTRLQRLLGVEDRRIIALRPRPAYVAEQRFAEPITHADAIEHALEPLIEQIVGMLESAGQGGRRFEATFFRIDGATRRIAIETGRPSRDPRAIFRLMQTKLDALADPLDPGYGFDLIRLAAPVAEPLAPLQPSFDGKTSEVDEIADLIDRLVARFGAGRVLRFAEVDTHDPVRSSRLVPVLGASDRPAPWRSPELGEPPSRPLQLFDPPQPIETIAETPDGPPIRFRWRRVLHEVARAEGPERIAPEWWRNPTRPTRDYYRVEDKDGRRFWIYRDGLYGRETDRPRWYLHGLFA